MVYSDFRRFLVCACVLFISFLTVFSQTFTEVSGQSGLSGRGYSPTLIGGGCAFFDYNNDGWLDIYLTGGLRADKLYRNNGNGTFTDRTMQAGLYWPTASYYTMGVVTGDIDNDGDRDIFVTTLGIGASYHSKAPNLLFRNNGNGTFTDISQQAGIIDSSWSVSASMGDYNLDGFLDIYVANYVKKVEFIFDSSSNVIGYTHLGYPNFLYINNGNGTFSNVAPQLIVDDDGTALAAALTDYDNDHDLDIYVANDFGEWVTPNKLYRNEFPADSFSDVSSSSGANAALYGMGIAIGDYDEDNDLDYYVTNIGTNVLLNNSGNGTFMEVAALAGVENTYVDSLFTTSWGTAFLDYDNDTWLDLVVTNGYIPSAEFNETSPLDPNKLYKNNMDGTFTDVSLQEGISDSSINRGCAYGDFDNDGDLDILMTAAEQDTLEPTDDHVLLFRNDVSNGNYWLKVSVRGTQNNRDGFGSRVEVYSNGRKWIREIDGGSSHASQHTSIAHFGLGSYTMADSIVVLWPGGGSSFLSNIPANQVITFIEGSAAQVTIHNDVELCQGDSVFAGGAFQFTSGTYYDSLPSPLLDTILITHVTVYPNKTTSLQFSICQDDSIFLAGSYQITDSVFYDTLQTSRGCDSIVISELMVTPPLIAIADAYLCYGDSIYAGGDWQKENGSYYDTIPDTPCHYIVITSLYVFPPIVNDTINETVCEGDSIFAGGDWQTSSGFYPDTFYTWFDCDSILVTNIDFVPPSFTLDTIIISQGDSVYVAGAWQTMPGTYTDYLVGAGGCDSVIITELVVFTGLEGSDANHADLSVNPNPSQAGFTISYSIPVDEDVKIEMFSATGKIITTLLDERVIAGKHALEFSEATLATGIYIISLKSGSYLKWVKVVFY